MNKTTRFAIGLTLQAALVLVACDAPSTPESPIDSSAPPESADSGSGVALDEALNVKDPFARARTLATLLPTLGTDAVPDVQRALGAPRFGLGAADYELMLRFWASHDPSAAASWAVKRAMPNHRISAITITTKLWAAADPRAAALAVQRLRAEANNEVSTAAQMALVQGWFGVDRQGLEQYMEGLGSGVERQRAIYSYALALIAAEGSDAAMRWAEAVPDDNERYKLGLYRQLTSALSWSDMPGALRWCEAQCDGPLGRGIRDVILRTRLRNGEFGGDVVEWVAQAPDGDEAQRERKLHSLWVAYATWAYMDRQAALDWMAQKNAGEPDPWVHHLFGEYARQLAPTSPAEAIAWAGRVEDPAEREQTVIRVAQIWCANDSKACNEWLGQSSLSEAARQQARRVPAAVPAVPPS